MLDAQKHLFSLPDDLHYLDCAYMSPLPRAVEEAGIQGLYRKRVPSDIAPEDFFTDCDEIRRRFARLINAADPGRVAIVPSVSYGLAIVARNTRLSPDQNVVIVANQFPSNVYVWRRATRDSGAELRVVPESSAERRSPAWTEAVLESVDGSTALVSLGQVHWTDGTLLDLQRIGERAREVGAAFIVDGTQSVGAYPFDVDRLKPDAVICAGYKWLLGPHGIGVAYFGERYDDGVPLEETWIGRVGSEDFRRLVDYQDSYREKAIRYDAGESNNLIHVPMLKAALDLVLEWGVDAIQSYCRALVEPLARHAKERGWFMEDESGRGSHLLGLRFPPTFDVTPLPEELDRNRVSVSLRGDSVRVSPHVYNDSADIDALIAALDRCR